jgi:hypothetical protein
VPIKRKAMAPKRWEYMLTAVGQGRKKLKRPRPTGFIMEIE